MITYLALPRLPQSYQMSMLPVPAQTQDEPMSHAKLSPSESAWVSVTKPTSFTTVFCCSSHFPTSCLLPLVLVVQVPNLERVWMPGFYMFACSHLYSLIRGAGSNTTTVEIVGDIVDEILVSCRELFSRKPCHHYWQWQCKQHVR